LSLFSLFSEQTTTYLTFQGALYFLIPRENSILSPLIDLVKSSLILLCLRSARNWTFGFSISPLGTCASAINLWKPQSRGRLAPNAAVARAYLQPRHSWLQIPFGTVALGALIVSSNRPPIGSSFALEGSLDLTKSLNKSDHHSKSWHRASLQVAPLSVHCCLYCCTLLPTPLKSSPFRPSTSPASSRPQSYSSNLFTCCFCPIFRPIRMIADLANEIRGDSSTEVCAAVGLS